MALTKVTYSMIEDAPVNVADFIPAGTNTATTDCQPFFADAIQAAAGQRTVFVPSGTYLIETPIELNWSTDDTVIYQTATRFVGESAIDTIILNRSGDYGLKHTVTYDQANNLGAGVRMSNGIIANFTLKTDGSSPAGSAGIKLFSFWYGTVENVYISSSKEHGLYLPVDNTLASNPDRYSCGALFVKTCDIRSSTGWGIRAEMWSITWNLQTNYIVGNELGGIYTTGSGHQIIGNAVAGNGTQAGASTAAGIHLSYGAGQGTPHNVLIRETELQENWGQHLIIEGYNHIIMQNRLLQDGTSGAGGTDFRNAYGMKFDATASGSARDILVLDTLFRFDNAGAATMFGYYVVNAAGTENIRFENTTWASSPPGLTKYDFPNNRNRIYGIQDGLQVAGGGAQQQYSPYQLTVVRPNNSDMTTAGKLLVFTADYDPLARWTGGSGNPNQNFTASFSGVMRIDATLVLRQATINTAITIELKKNGSTIQTFLWPNGFPTTDDYTVSFNAFVKVSGGDVFEFFGVSTTAASSFSISSSGACVIFQYL